MNKEKSEGIRYGVEIDGIPYIVITSQIRTIGPSGIVKGMISIMHEQTEMQHIISIEGIGLDYPFFGLAFHLLYDQDAYEFDHFTLGDFFTSADDPLALIEKNPDEPEIIAGLSLKRGQTMPKSDGTFLKLYFNKKVHEPGIYGFVFEHGVFSTFDEKRKDITEVEFKSI